MRCEDLLPLRLVQHLGHRRLDDAGRDRVHRDAAAGNLAGEGAREADLPRLRGGVVGLARVADEAIDAA